MIKPSRTKISWFYNLIEHTVENRIQMGMSPPSVKSIACVGQKINKSEQKKIPI